MKVTIDTNCFIDIELQEGAFQDLGTLIVAHERGEIEIGISAIAASERYPGNRIADDFSEFKGRVQALSNKEIDILKPISTWGVAYWNWFIWAGEEHVELESKIHSILFPNAPETWVPLSEPSSEEEREYLFWTDKNALKWRNRKCDTLAMWSHIHYSRDIFISRDKNFHKESKKSALISLGAKDILYPKEAIKSLRSAGIIGIGNSL